MIIYNDYQSLRETKPRLCLRGPGQEPAAGADLGEAGWYTKVPAEPSGLETRSELGVAECVCSWGCRCVWLWC